MSDTLASHIRLEDYSRTGLPEDFTITDVMDDIIMAKYIDTVDGEGEGQGDYVDRGGILVGIDKQRSCWRVAEVLMVGPNVSEKIKEGTCIMIPNDKGIKAVNFSTGKNKQPVVFINEERIFCICVRNEE